MPKFIINVKEKGAKKAAGNIKSLTSSMKMMALQAVTVTAVVQGLKKSIQMSAEMEGVKRGFDNLAKSQGFSTVAFNKFRAATDGTIDSLTLMKQANNAMLLGITDSEDQMADMFDVAQRLGASLGVDTVQAVESLVTGLGRQSKLMLDNLGIMVDTNKAYEDYADSIGKTTSQLTDQERKTAFVNAAMKEANSLVAQLGEEQLTTKDAMAQAATAASDVAVSLGNLLSPSIIRSAELFVGAAEAVNTYLISLKALDTESIMVKGTHEKVGEAIDANENRLKVIASRTYGSANMTARYKDEVENLERQLVELNKRYMETNILMVDSVEGFGVLSGSTDNMNTSLNITNTETTDYLANLKKVEGQQMTSISSWDIMTLGIRRNTLERARNVKENLKGYAMTSATAEDAMKSVVKAESMEAVAGLIASIFKTVPFPLNAILAAGAGATASGLIDKGLASFATGADFVTSGPQMMMVGDNPSGMERVSVTPLGGDPNINGPQAGGGSVTVNVSGNVLSQDFVEGELAENIKEAIRRGTDFGIS